MVRANVAKLGAGLVVATAVAVIVLLPNKTRVTRAVDADPPQQIRLNGTLRDFRRDHPDFDVVPDGGLGHYAGNVARQLGDDGRPTFTGGGFRVLSQWRDLDGRPIAPHLASAAPVLTECTMLPGIAVDGVLSVDNQSRIDSYDSRLGTYGPGNTGSAALVATNSTAAGAVAHRNSSDIFGEVLIGPGGDPSVVYQQHPACTLSGGVGNLAASMPIVPLPEPEWLGGSSGALRIATGPFVLADDRRVDSLEIDSTGSLDIAGAVTLLCDGEVKIKGRGIRILPGGSLRLYVGGELECSTAPCNMTGGDPSRFVIYALGTERLKIEGNESLVTARIFAPRATLQITQGSQLFGTFAGRSIQLDNNARFHVDVAYSGPYVPSADAPGVAGPADTGAISSAETFAQWFRDVPGVNMSKVHTITLNLGADGWWSYETSAFHPADGQLLGDDSGGHNHFLTWAAEARFTYEPCAGQRIELDGDDDAWIFIDDRLVMDRGGVLPGSEQVVDLDRLGLAPGGSHRMVLLYAQRQDVSARFALRTNIQLVSRPLVPAVTDQYD